MTCGWFKKKKKKQLTAQELLDRDGLREEILTRDNLSRASMKHGNCSTGIGPVNTEIARHRDFTQFLWEEVHDAGKSLARVAKEHDLTVNIVKQLLASALMQQNHNVKNQPKPTRPYKTLEEKEREWDEVRAKRDAPKPGRTPTFSKMEDVPDESIPDTYGGCEMAGVSSN
jgi:hypothetical protein